MFIENWKAFLPLVKPFKACHSSEKAQDLDQKFRNQMLGYEFQQHYPDRITLGRSLNLNFLLVKWE